MLKKILVALGVVVLGILVYAAMQPDDFRLERSIVVKATPEKPFAFVNDFQQWPQWSPWEKKDPNMTRTRTGASQGVGAIYAWQGNSEVGKGQMEILESTPGKHIKIKLDFFEPMPAQNFADFSFQTEGENTKVIWAMYGKNNFLCKLFQVFVSMEKMVGPDFEAGLSNLKMLTEK